jgi:hypothetical protein
MALGVPWAEEKQVRDVITTVVLLREKGVVGAGVNSSYLRWRVVPLMERKLSLFEMAANALTQGTVLATDVPRYTNVVRYLEQEMDTQKDAHGSVVPFVFLVPGCPAMWPEQGFLEFVSDDPLSLGFPKLDLFWLIFWLGLH